MAERILIEVPDELIRRDIAFTDKETGERRMFNSVTLPKGCHYMGEDLSGWEFSARFLNPAKVHGKGWSEIPLLADNIVRVQTRAVDEQGNFELDEFGKTMRIVRKVPPASLKEAVETAFQREGI